MIKLIRILSEIQNFSSNTFKYRPGWKILSPDGVICTVLKALPLKLATKQANWNGFEAGYLLNPGDENDLDPNMPWYSLKYDDRDKMQWFDEKELDYLNNGKELPPGDDEDLDEIKNIPRTVPIKVVVNLVKEFVHYLAEKDQWNYPEWVSLQKKYGLTFGSTVDRLTRLEQENELALFYTELQNLFKKTKEKLG